MLDHNLTKKMEKKCNNLYGKWRSDYHNNNTYVYTHVCPSKFYGVTKVHKISKNDTVDEFPIRLILLNIGSAKYDLAKYLALLGREEPWEQLWVVLTLSAQVRGISMLKLNI